MQSLDIPFEHMSTYPNGFDTHTLRRRRGQIYVVSLRGTVHWHPRPLYLPLFAHSSFAISAV